MKYRKKQVEVKAITFDELVEYGRTHGANIVDGMPTNFGWEGCLVNLRKDFYVVSNPGRLTGIRPGEAIIKDDETFYSVDIETLNQEFDPIPSLPQSATDILDSKVVKIDNILTDMRTNRIDPAACGAQICELFAPEITQLEVAKRLIKAVHTGNGTNSKEVEELVKEWESVSGEIING